MQVQTHPAGNTCDPDEPTRLARPEDWKGGDARDLTPIVHELMEDDELAERVFAGKAEAFAKGYSVGARAVAEYDSAAPADAMEVRIVIQSRAPDTGRWVGHQTTYLAQVDQERYTRLTWAVSGLALGLVSPDL